MTQKKSRSGTQWTEADYAAAGYATLKLRVKQGTAEALASIAALQTVSRAQVVTGLVERELRRLGRKNAKVISHGY